MSEMHHAQGREAVGTELLVRFVDEVLNAGSPSALSEIFAPTFRDNHPLRIPGVLEPPGKKGTIADLRAVVNLLASPVLDMGFVLEDVFEAEGRVAYRLFGEGTVALAPIEPTNGSVAPDAAQAATRRFDLVDTRLSIRTLGWPEGKILMNRAVVMYSCVGIFRVLGSQFAERWGPEVVE